MKVCRAKILAILGAMLLVVWAPGASAESELENRKASFQSRLDELEAPAATLQDQYIGYLRRQLEERKQSGDLAAVLAIEEELKAPGEIVLVESYPALEKAQEVFIKGLQAAAETRRRKQANVFQQYEASLTAYQIELTKEDRIPEAKAVHAEVERVKKLQQESEVAPATEPDGEPEIVMPSEIRNDLPGDPGSGENRSTYIIESDGTEGTLFMAFEHPLLGSKDHQLAEATLEFTIATTQSADTHESILVFAGDREIGSKVGGEKAEEIAIPLNVEALREAEKLELELRCGGTNAAVLKKGEDGPRLKLRFRR